jgi:hypothetical protein
MKSEGHGQPASLARVKVSLSLHGDEGNAKGFIDIKDSTSTEGRSSRVAWHETRDR